MTKIQFPEFPPKIIRILIKRGYLKTSQIADRKAVESAVNQCFADTVMEAKDRGWHEAIIAAIGAPPSREN
jgi:hypothetical protein